MKRNQSSRASSPTPTTFSGISNYRTESYRPVRDQGSMPAMPSQYLVAYLTKCLYNLIDIDDPLKLNTNLAAPANSRSTARQKLTRLTRQQFQELSTDVYDELIRRKMNTSENEILCLPPRDEFHPKRNQARQKLATLPAARFEDLSSDVYFELSRRYPEFKEENEVGTPPVGSPGSAYDDMPSPEFHASPRSDAPTLPSGSRIARISEERGIDNGYGSHMLGRRPSEDAFARHRPSDDEVPPRRSEDAYGSDTNPYGLGSRKKLSQDVARGADFGRRPSASASIHSDSTSTTNAQSATATSGMIIPNKSTIAEEDIEVPYGREEARDSSVMVVDRGRDGDGDGDTFGGMGEEHEHESPSIGGLSALGARLRGQVSGDALDDDEGNGARSGDDYFDKVSLGRASVTSDRSASAVRSIAGRVSVGGEDHERLRREYEFKIATMQGRIVTLERDLGNAEQREKELREAQQHIKLLEEEIDGFRKRAEDHAAAVRALQKELDELRELRAREKEREMKRAQNDEEELQILRDRLERLEDERGGALSQDDSEMIEQLRSDMDGLMTELSDLGRRNDELMTAKDADLAVIRDLNNQLKEYKRKYELAKTELRSVKATSQLHTPAPKTDDQMPTASDGGLLDIHVTAFVSGIDSLLTAGRSNAPTRVLMPMKAVVNATSAIIEDVRAYELRPMRVNVDINNIRSLRERLEATLSNLVVATKTHAVSSGMSPVSLLDAAASHVSATVTDISRIIYIRKATRAEQEEFSVPPLASQPPPALRSIEELRSGHERKSSAASSRRGEGELSASRFMDRRGASSSEPSSSSTNSPPPLFDKSPIPGSGVISDDSAPPEDAWSELKPYLEAQTESIVYAIQSVLSGVRTPIPAPTLNENLTQIITIVSSIVAVCSGNLPPTSAQQGAEILEQLSEHAKKLQEVQALPEVTKESRQIMAKSSFAIANAMKGLMKLGER
ncbi:hypothetical protein JVT61DRAFT_495 [Boletus reticuloceps]|uniref:GIT Spa2 homology (SHD) domain-containing protein n=1 Tax=Boletus reticuloceps TaxID=495285 RepID=A0A8I2YZV6_9AGAM|nr:hypothetical protein JVT61DRAFT_495 [Boletus reticuloceps]